MTSGATAYGMPKRRAHQLIEPGSRPRRMATERVREDATRAPREYIYGTVRTVDVVNVPVKVRVASLNFSPSLEQFSSRVRGRLADHQREAGGPQQHEAYEGAALS